MKRSSAGQRRKGSLEVTSDSSDSSDSDIVRRVNKNARLKSDSGNGELLETKDVPVQEPQPSSSKVINLNEHNRSSPDSSDGDAEKCPICLTPFKNQEVGSPEACNHIFCAKCIKEWAKSDNTCPLDRKKFNLILVRCNYNGQYVRSIPVQQPTNNELGDPFEEQQWHITCLVCGLTENQDRMLVCDECDCSYHLDCLELSEEPVGEWFCPECTDVYLYCPVCGLTENQDRMLVCDQCGCSYHLDCLELSEEPVGEWFCPECINVHLIQI